MTNIIEPCCAERQLGQLLREAHGHAALFQTNGDVTAKLFIKDTMLLSGDRPRTLTISAPTLPQEAMRLIGRYAQLGYISRLRLMLEEQPDPSLFTSEAFHSSLFTSECAIVPHAPELMMWRGLSHTVVIQGTMPDTVTPALHLYAGMLCGNQSLTLRAATDAFEALFRARRVETSDESLSPDPSPKGEGSDQTSDVSPQPSEVNPVPGDSQQTETAAKKRKKKSEI